MSLSIYDDALVKKIKSWIPNTDVHVYGASDLARTFEVLADENNDKPLQLPFIIIRRKGGYNITNVNKQPLSYDGKTLDASYDRSVQLNAIPITIEYQLDVYTRYQKDADEYVRNIVFNIINFPKLHAELEYEGQNIQMDSTLLLGQNIEDNSDVPERMVAGMFTRYTMSITVPDAYLWDIRIRDNIHMGDVFIRTIGITEK